MKNNLKTKKYMENKAKFDYKKEKFKILKTLHESLGREIEESRNQTTKLTVTFSGFTIALMGILIQSESVQSFLNKILMTGGVFVLYIIMIIMSRSMKMNFSELASFQKRIEIIWGLHDDDIFIDGEKLMPDKWLKYGAKKWKEPVFRNAYRIASLLAIFALIVIWLK